MVFARKRFGQNFLHDRSVIAHIIEAIDPKPGDPLVEIGPGRGALTEDLLQAAGAMDAIEIDRDLGADLQHRFGERGLHLHVTDALRFDFAAPAEAKGQRLRIIGNLPYNISTPLQVAHATAVLAANGKVFRPQLVSHIRDTQEGALKTNPNELVRTVAIDPDHLRRVRAAMVDVMRPGGTAVQAGAGALYAIAGKTGTSQVIAIKQGETYDERRVQERHRDHAWFMAFAPAEKPTIALVVLVENSGHGSSAAAPIARQVLDYWLLGKQPDGMQPKLDPGIDTESN